MSTTAAENITTAQAKFYLGQRVSTLVDIEGRPAGSTGIVIEVKDQPACLPNRVQLIKDGIPKTAYFSDNELAPVTEVKEAVATTKVMLDGQTIAQVDLTPLVDSSATLLADMLLSIPAKLLLDAAANQIGGQEAAHYLADEMNKELVAQCKAPEDVYRFRLTIMNNDGWFSQGVPQCVFPEWWLPYLAQHTKLLTLALLLARFADDNGCVLDAKPWKFAQQMKVSTEKILAYLLQLAALGVIEFTYPVDTYGKLRINIGLLSEPPVIVNCAGGN